MKLVYFLVTVIPVAGAYYWLDPAVLFSNITLISIACIVDYLGLWKTRLFFNRFNSISARIIIVGPCFVDFLATTFLYFMIVSAVGLLILGSPISNTVWEFTHSTLILFYYAALVTSGWLWAYILIAYALRLLSFIPVGVRFLSQIMDLNEHPVRSVGYVAASVISTIIVVITVL